MAIAFVQGVVVVAAIYFRLTGLKMLDWLKLEWMALANFIRYLTFPKLRHKLFCHLMDPVISVLLEFKAIKASWVDCTLPS